MNDTPSNPRGVFAMLRRGGELIRTIVGFGESVKSLKEKTEKLSERVDALQRDVDQQAGQIRILLQFVERSMDRTNEQRIDDAVKKALADRPAPKPKRKS